MAHSGLYCVIPIYNGQISKENILCRARGVFKKENLSPIPGDIVSFEKTSSTKKVNTDLKFEDGTLNICHIITGISSRKSVLSRPLIANLTHIFIVVPSCDPNPDLLTVDKLTSISEYNNIEPVIIVTKSDLSREKARLVHDIYKSCGFEVFSISSSDMSSIEQLRSYIKDQSMKNGYISSAFAGESGVGKSTLLNMIFPGLNIRTSEISKKAQRGKQTTRKVELYPMYFGDSSCLLADTPGFSSIDFTQFNLIPLDDLADSFREFKDKTIKCKYRNCTHLSEEGCEIIREVNKGNIPSTRHDHYVKIYNEIKETPVWKKKKDNVHTS